MQAKGKATLAYGEGKTIEFPVYGGSIGPDVVDIRALYSKTGMFTYDPGFMSTASCQSAITYIDGDEGNRQNQGLAPEARHLVQPRRTRWMRFPRPISGRGLRYSSAKGCFPLLQRFALSAC